MGAARRATTPRVRRFGDRPDRIGGVTNSHPRFLQGAYPFEGQGLEDPVPLDGGSVSYKVPSDRRAQLVYFRGGNSTDQLVYAALARDGEVMRLFPMGAKESTHVPLRVVEDLRPDTTLDVRLAAPEGLTGTVVVDVGIIES